MVLPFLGPLIGGAFSLIGGNKAAKASKAESMRIARYNYEMGKNVRKADVKAQKAAEIRANAWAVKAETRNEKLKKRDQWRNEQSQIRAENREYERNDPANQRRRMEEAGFNPLIGGIGPMTSTIGASGSGGQSAGGMAPQANGVRGAFAPAADNSASMGRIMADSINGLGHAFIEADQLQIQKQELDMQQQKLNILAKEMAFKPHVPDVYERRSGRVGIGGSPDNRYGVGVGADGEAGSLGASPLGKPQMEEFNLYVKVYDPTTDRYVTIPNPDLMDAGPVEMATGMSIIGTADAIQNGIPAAVGGANKLSKSGFPASMKWSGGKYSPPTKNPHPPSGWMKNQFGTGWMQSKFQ